MHLSEQPINGITARLPLEFLRHRGIDSTLVINQLESFIENGQMTHAQWWSALERIQDLLPDPRTMFSIGQFMEVRHLGVLGYLLLTSNTVGETLMRLQRFIPLIHQSDTISVSFEGTDACITWSRDYGDSQLLSDEVYFSCIQRFMQLVCENDGQHFSKLELCYPAPPHTHLYHEVFRCPISFQCERTRIFVPQHILVQPLKHADPTMSAALEKQAQALLVSIPQSSSFLNELKGMIVSSLQDGTSSADQFAGKLGISRRTLHRRLSEHQLDFSTLLRTTRMELAKQYLQDKQLALSEVALLLGYADQSAFTRAFSEWFGETPTSHRKKYPKECK
jgi:AraC-like DNA-binding protein